MKICSTCNRTYPDDSLAFCLMDGAVLSAPYDPEATQRISPPRNTSPAVTEALKATAAPDQPRPALMSTIRAPAPQLPPQYAPPHSSYSAERRSALPVWLIAITVLLAGVLGVVLLVPKLLREKPVTTQSSPSSAVTENTKQTNTACGHSLGKALYDRWIQGGGESGKLGCPIADEVEAPASGRLTKGRWAQFAGGDGGYLILHGSGPDEGKLFEVRGCMFKLYSSLGGTKSWLGFPLGDESPTSSGTQQWFEYGLILWDSKTSQCKAHEQTLK